MIQRWNLKILGRATACTVTPGRKYSSLSAAPLPHLVNPGGRKLVSATATTTELPFSFYFWGRDGLISLLNIWLDPCCSCFTPPPFLPLLHIISPSFWPQRGPACLPTTPEVTSSSFSRDSVLVVCRILAPFPNHLLTVTRGSLVGGTHVHATCLQVWLVARDGAYLILHNLTIKRWVMKSERKLSLHVHYCLWCTKDGTTDYCVVVHYTTDVLLLGSTAWAEPCLGLFHPSPSPNFLTCTHPTKS